MADRVLRDRLYWTGDYIMDEVELGVRVALRILIEAAKARLKSDG